MQTIKIPFSGITRNTDDGVCSDGECMELVNARVNNGSIEPVSKPVPVANFSSTYKKMYYHAKSDMYLAITSSNTLEQISSDFTTVTTLSTSLTGVTGVELLGNVVSCLTTSGLRYMLWKNNAYYYLGGLPELPQISISMERKVQSTVGQAAYNVTNAGRYNNDDGKFTLWYNSYYGYNINNVSLLNEEGYFVGFTGIRFAFRLFDGSYIKHSPIRVLSKYATLTGDTATVCDDYKYTCHDTDTWNSQDFTFWMEGYKPIFTFDSFNLESWKDLIISIDIFATKGFRKQWDIGYSETLDKDTPANVVEDFIKEGGYYKIGKISLSGKYTETSKNVSADDIALNDRLEDDSYTHNSFIADKSYIYNNRLHIYGIKSSIFEGYDKDYLYDFSKSSLGTGSIDVSVYLNTTNGTSVVKKSFTNISIPQYIPSYLMYPDSRAYKMVINITYGTTNKSIELELTPHRTLNLSYYMNMKGYTDGTPTGAYSIGYLDVFYWELWDSSLKSVTPVTIVEEDNNKLKVSSLNNPFYFPPATTYQFQTKIMAVQSNTTALSQGQFGQFPLYVFCLDGVYAMSVGTSGVVYSTINPVSRDICISSNVCGIDSAVIFTTERGVMAISGVSVECISEALTGFLPSCVISSPIIPKILQIPALDGCLEDVTFNEYLADAKIGYNYQDSEIVISNVSYPFSFVFNMKSKQWHKINVCVYDFVISYPNTYALVGQNALYNLYNPHRSVSKFALLTRPVKIGTNTHKRILQSALRGIVKRSLSDLYLRGEQVQLRGEDLTIFSDVGLYILGSNDMEHFELVSAKEKIVDIRDLVTKMNKSKAYKSFMVCLVGGVRSDVAINYLEMIVDETYTNRLR